MSDSVRNKYEQRLARYQAVIAHEIPDRIPISAGSNFFAEVYAGFNKQEFIYKPETWMSSDRKFVEDFPEVDNLRSGRLWAPMADVVGWNLYKIPGRDISPDVQFQFVEGERMKEDEYDLFIENPGGFIFEKVLPRNFDEFKERGSMRSYMAFLKSGLTTMMFSDFMKERSQYLENELGMPLPMMGGMLAPFDYLADGLRGLNGIMIDLFERPEKVLEACESIIPHIVNAALASADPLRRYPIFMPLHRGCNPFLSPRQFETFYWPSLKKAMMMLIDAGYCLRIYLEGDWGPNWKWLREIPKGKLICDIDTPADIFKAKEEIGDWHCLAGGVPDSTLILGSPDEVRERVRLVCEKLGEGGGFIINGGCGIPHDAKPENYHAMIDAVLEFGRYKDAIDFEPRLKAGPPDGWSPPTKEVMVPWSIKKADIGQIVGDEGMIREYWEKMEHMAYNWLWNWLW